MRAVRVRRRKWTQAPWTLGYFLLQCALLLLGLLVPETRGFLIVAALLITIAALVLLPAPRRDMRAVLGLFRPSEIPSRKRKRVKARRRIPERYVQEYARNVLIDQLGYSADTVQMEYKLRSFGSSKRADVVVFNSPSERLDRNVMIVVECKHIGHACLDEAKNQLRDYLMAFQNAEYGVLASDTWHVFKVAPTGRTVEIIEIDGLPSADGARIDITYDVLTFAKARIAERKALAASARQT